MISLQPAKIRKYNVTKHIDFQWLAPMLIGGRNAKPQKGHQYIPVSCYSTTTASLGWAGTVATDGSGVEIVNPKSYFLA